MAVYVDDMKANYRRMRMCHMIADTTPELLDMADRIGVRRQWIQKAGSRHEHFDICLTKRAKAIAAGAVEITQRELAMKCRDRHPSPPNTAEAGEQSCE